MVRVVACFSFLLFLVGFGRVRFLGVGVCGGQLMVFNLAVLKRTGGLDMVLAAIVYGFILSLLVPILIAFFSA
ncbi:transporter [Escherichia coli]|nr:transporter [Escherichia coli]